MSFALVKSKGPILGDGAIYSSKTLRHAIPAAPLLAMLADAALSGKMRRIDTATGEEIEQARPIDVEDQMKVAQYLLDKRLPSHRAAEIEEGAKVDLKDAPLTPEEIKRLPLSELTRVIEATYEVTHEEATDLRPRASDSSLDGDSSRPSSASEFARREGTDE